jgi:Na+/proline symporter
MSLLDWIVLGSTILFIVLYGIWKSKNIKNTEGFLLGNRDLKWYTIGLSIMATQASAITFLSTPGQAFQEGMGFAQFYFGLPIAMVILSVFVLPIYYKLKVYTAYEYLEGRFDVNTRTLTSVLFMIQRGMAAGITIFAPSIILSSILGWSLFYTNFLIGGLVIFYTVLGGTNAVSQTQKQQMIVILSGMVIAGIVVVNKLPENVSLGDAVGVAGMMGKLNIVDFEFDLNEKYNIWTAMFGGVFLFLSYFGTDQSQVQRYLSGKSLTESRLGLLFNGIFKVPMQFGILFIGVLVFIFYQFNASPLHFNNANVDKIKASAYGTEYSSIENELASNFEEKKASVEVLVQALDSENQATIANAQDRVNVLMEKELAIREKAKVLIGNYNDEELDAEDTDYVFITFVTKHLPTGLVGLLIAVIFSAAMSSTSSEINALATTSLVDIYKRSLVQGQSDQHYLKASKYLTVMWGLIALGFASFASLFDNLIEAVNIVGSVFYGAILGIFVVAFFFKFVKSKAIFLAAIIGELMVIAVFIADKMEILNIPYLFLNLIGCVLVVVISMILQNMFKD